MVEDRKQLDAQYGKLFEAELLQEITQHGVLKKAKKGEVLMEPQDYIKSMPLLLTGIIKIFREHEAGGEVLLYYLEKGDTCAMTLNCCSRDKYSEIKAVAYTPASFILVPVEKMKEWLKYESWREFVFESMNIRFNELLDAIDSLAFNKVEERLIKYLGSKQFMSKGGEVLLTHENIARDLNTSRVVVSRLLKKLEQEGKVELHRNHIQIIGL